MFINASYDFKNKKNIYVGEEVPLKIDLYKADTLSAVPVEYPEIKIDNVVFDNFGKLNRESDRFAPYPYGTPEHIIKDGTNYTKTTFFTSFRPLGSGTLDGTVSLLCNISIAQRSRLQSDPFSSFWGDSFFDNDSFFPGSFFNRGQKVSKLLIAKLPTFDIFPLPTPPSDITYLGLVGDWQVHASLSSIETKEGEPLTLSLKITGTGSLETLSAPEFINTGILLYTLLRFEEIARVHQSLEL